MEDEANLDISESDDQIVIDFGDICRFCLAETNNTISIYDKCFAEDFKENESSIFDFVTKITSIKMDNFDGFPSLVCENCFGIINMCLEFRQACQQSDLSLRDCYEKTLEEAKAKFSCKVIKKEDSADEVTSSVSPEQGIQTKDIVIKEESDVKDEKSGDLENISKNCNSVNESVKLNGRKEKGLFKNESLSVLKAGTIKQKYRRINSLSERLKEAQSKLVEDILRTKDLISISVKNESSKDESDYRVKFSCPQCVVSFVSSEMLTYHYITSHIVERKSQTTTHSFCCKMCNKQFSYMHQLMRHYKSMHKIPMSKLSAEYLFPKSNGESGKSGKSYKCLDCTPPKLFSKGRNLFRHLMEHEKVEDGLINGDRKVYKCTRCDSNQTFATKFSLNRHLMNIHKLNRSEIDETPDGPISKLECGDYGKTLGDLQTGLKLLKIYVCVDCTPPGSFPDLALFIQHKTDAHGKSLEGISLKELTPVYVESVNVFQDSDADERIRAFKVVCKCCETPSEFYSASDFVLHMKLYHEDVPNEKWDVETKFLLESLPISNRDRRWKCTECPASYIRKHSLHYHFREKHNKVLRLGGVKCPEPECKASFLTNRQVIHHGITVHKKYFANLHKVFKEKILQNGAEADKRVRNFECNICRKKYLGKTSLKRHILKTHLGKAEMENAICPYCGKTFSSGLNLKSHIDFVHEALFVSCPVCKKSINFKTIGKHYKVHQTNTETEQGGESRYLCNQCGRVLKSKSSFEDHQKLHSNVRDQICDVCGSGFTTKKNLYIHKKGHDLTQKKVFGCDKCEKVFTGKHTLNRHLLTHSGEKNFICEICSKCFYTLQELNRHVRYHRKEYRFDCQLCDMRFLDRSRFRHHMMRHRNIRPHKCHFCDKVFIVRRKMNLHMAARHNVEVQNTKAIWKDPKTYIPLDDLL